MTALGLAITAVGFLTAALSAVAGLGGGTVLIAVFYALGMAPTVAVPLFSAVQFVSNLSRTLAYARAVHWPAAGWFLLSGVPAPFLFAPLVVGANRHAIQLLLALLIALSLLPSKRGTAPLGPRASFLLAGLLNGSIGMFVGATGLFIGRLFLRPEWSKEKIIGTLALTQTLGHLLKVLAYASAGYGLAAQLDLLWPLALAVVFGTLAGRRLNRYFSEPAFRRLFRLILIVLAAKLGWDGLTGLGVLAWI